MISTVLIVDDEPEVCLSLSELLESRGFNVAYRTDPLAVPAAISDVRPDCIIMDIRMPGMDGVQLLGTLDNTSKNIPVIMISGNPTVDSAVRAMKFGAVNVFTKPIEIDDLINEIETVTRSKDAVRNENAQIPESEFISVNPLMEKILSQVVRGAPTDATVLITGESGTGKELVANLIHRSSNRAGRPFLTVNCAAIPESLLESEIFGHEKGAFTDAHERREGLFERASDGTVFLDEIADMSPKTQAKMLRVIQDRRFSRLGGSEVLESRCRVIAATNKDLSTLMGNGGFRDDLYYRLSVIHHHLPPMRERPDDIQPLAEHYLALFASKYGKTLRGFDPEVKKLLRAHTWPGNVREIRNVVHRASIFATDSFIHLEDLPDQYAYIPYRQDDLSESYDERAREVIREALIRSGGKRGEAARMLNIDRKTLYNRMKKLGLET